jgi:hypothetical protein
MNRLCCKRVAIYLFKEVDFLMYFISVEKWLIFERYFFACECCASPSIQVFSFIWVLIKAVRLKEWSKKITTLSIM